MKFGMPALVECNDIYDCLKVAGELGLDFVEMNSSFPGYLPSSLDIARLRELRKKSGIFYTMHADEQMNPFDFNKKVSDCYFSCMKELLELAAALEMPIINLHLLKGVYVTLPQRVILLTDVYKDEYIDRVKRFIKMTEEQTKGTNVRVAIENVDSNPFTSSQLDALELFMKSPSFALTLDVGHEMCLAYKDTPVFEKYPEKLSHMHLHDCDGKHPHLPLGEGIMNVEEKLGMLKDDSTCVIEVKTIEGLKASTDYLRSKKYI